MSRVFPMVQLFGSFLADGDRANRFRFCEIEPFLVKEDVLVFDFQGVTNMTDSFCRACFETLASNFPTEVTEKIRFKNCSPLIHEFLADAIACGLSLRQTKANLAA